MSNGGFIKTIILPEHLKGLYDLSCTAPKTVTNFKFDLEKAEAMVRELQCEDGACINATGNGRMTCKKCLAAEYIGCLIKSQLVSTS